MKRIAILLAITVCYLPLSAIAQSSGGVTSKAPCTGIDYRAFDFWVGDWTVTNAAGNEVGKNLIELTEGGCLLMENWTSAQGGTGQSMNYWDPEAKIWKQVWVSSNGSVGHFEGNIKDRDMVLVGDMLSADGSALLLKGTWTLLEDGRVRQHFEQSTDKGETWSTWFDGYYAKK